MRQEVLEGFGWHFHRIWSTDWFYRRGSETKRLEQAIEDAKDRDYGQSLKGSNVEIPNKPDAAHEQDNEQNVVLHPNEIKLPLYQKANVTTDNIYEPHDRPILQAAEILRGIIEVEVLGPRDLARI